MQQYKWKYIVEHTLNLTLYSTHYNHPVVCTLAPFSGFHKNDAAL